MPRHHVTVECSVDVTPRMLQAGAMLDMQPNGMERKEWDIEEDLASRPWKIGLIVGPSGDGKTTIARKLFNEIHQGFEWQRNRSIVDEFPRSMSVTDVVSLLNNMGLSSPPVWMRPHCVLSNGERFRCDMARLMAETPKDGPPIVVDEFTSLVDRQVAQVASHTIQKFIRRSERQFVAITCHYDIADWLQPDWTLVPSEGKIVWRSLQRRPEIQLDIYRITTSAWRMFEKHHYMNATINRAARCYGAFVGERMVGFFSALYFPHPHSKIIWHAHRIVVLPDWQGLGIGAIGTNWLGNTFNKEGKRFIIVTNHPGLIASHSKSNRWKFIGKAKGGDFQKKKGGKGGVDSLRKQRIEKSAFRYPSSFEYIPEISNCMSMR